jgi:cytochrome c oxidase subunit 2
MGEQSEGWRSGWHAVRRRAVALAALALAATGAGCGKQSPLSPHSQASREIADLWWWMLGAAAIVFLGALALLAIGWLRRDRPGLPLLGESERANTGLVLVFGMVVPAVVLAVLFAFSNLYVIHDTEAPNPKSTALTITVIGHQWFWEVRYPGTPAVTANEIHIPAGARVNVVARTADVIHSFWVPELNRKIDMIPGRSNRVLLHAEAPGVYRGQCAEFCGLQHANMAMSVDAEPWPQFRRWLSNMAKPATAPSNPLRRRGEQVFLSSTCAGCHTIRGTSAAGRVGPDLTHLATRGTLAALTIPNNRRELGAWIRDPQHIKPGNKMPGLNLSSRDLHALVAYLSGLR